MNSVVIHGTWQDELPKLADESVDLIIIDPPYLTTSEKWDKEEAVNSELSRQLFRIAKPSCSLYVWCGIGEKSQSLIRWFPIFSEHWHFKDLITWKKRSGIGMRKGWLYTREEIMWFVKDNNKFVWNKAHQYSNETRKMQSERTKRLKDGTRKTYANKSSFYRISNVWDDIREVSWTGGSKVSHFTPKPPEAIKRVIDLHTESVDTILDCFAGSGTTGVVAKQLGRNYILIESDKEYVDLINERLGDV